MSEIRLIDANALKKALNSNCDICPDKNTNWCDRCCPHMFEWSDGGEKK